eukprot:248920-Pelagomonas_calceolata.AAC.3
MVLDLTCSRASLSCNSPATVYHYRAGAWWHGAWSHANPCPPALMWSSLLQVAQQSHTATGAAHIQLFGGTCWIRSGEHAQAYYTLLGKPHLFKVKADPDGSERDHSVQQQQTLKQQGWRHLRQMLECWQLTTVTAPCLWKSFTSWLLIGRACLRYALAFQLNYIQCYPSFVEEGARMLASVCSQCVLWCGLLRSAVAAGEDERGLMAGLHRD